jgi:pre-rRNA-processing protein IPI3
LRLWSASSDGTVKLWDLRTRSLLTNFEVGGVNGKGEVTSLAADPTGRFCFVGTSSGRLERIDLYRRIGGADAQGWEARGGGGMEDVEKVGEENGSHGKTGIQLR